MAVTELGRTRIQNCESIGWFLFINSMKFLAQRKSLIDEPGAPYHLCRLTQFKLVKSCQVRYKLNR